MSNKVKKPKVKASELKLKPNYPVFLGIPIQIALAVLWFKKTIFMEQLFEVKGFSFNQVFCGSFNRDNMAVGMILVFAVFLNVLFFTHCAEKNKSARLLIFPILFSIVYLAIVMMISSGLKRAQEVSMSFIGYAAILICLVNIVFSIFCMVSVRKARKAAKEKAIEELMAEQNKPVDEIKEKEQETPVQPQAETPAAPEAEAETLEAENPAVPENENISAGNEP
jgi:hypothetical protein